MAQRGCVKLILEVIPVGNWDTQSRYNLPISLPPIFPNDLNQSGFTLVTCFFEGTIVSCWVGARPFFHFRLTAIQDPCFRKIYIYTISINGHVQNTTHSQDQSAMGVDLRNESPIKQFTLKYLLDALSKIWKRKGHFSTITSIPSAGTDPLGRRNDLRKEKLLQKLRASGHQTLISYKKLRRNFTSINNFLTDNIKV